MNRRGGSLAGLVPAIGLWICWTIATYLLEGRLLTLNRPDDATGRILYAVIANLAIGTVVAMAILRGGIRRGVFTAEEVGFGGTRRTVATVAIATVVGSAAFFVQGPPTLHPAVLLNGYTQVLVVSVAEVLVCWAVLGGTLAAMVRPSRRWGTVGAAVVAAALFGVYHFAHSPPFDTLPMVLLLSAVGLVTSAFFFLSRDVYATIVFHNFLGAFGVLEALGTAGRLEAYTTVQAPLVAAAALSLAMLIGLDSWWIRRSGQ